MVNKLQSLGIQIYLSEIIRLYNKGNVKTRETLRCSGAHFLHNLNDLRIFDFQSSISEILLYILLLKDKILFSNFNVVIVSTRSS